MSALLDGHLDEADRLVLEAMLATSPKARKLYCEHMELHASLHLAYTEGQAVDFMPGRPSQRRRSRRALWAWGLTAAASFAVVTTALVWTLDRSTKVKVFATLDKTLAAQWNDSDLPTAEGSRLGPGTLHLREGIAVIRFDSGAVVTLEAPAVLALNDAMNCTLTDGIAVADVPETAHGFRILTSTAMVIDYGTRFSVTVDGMTGETRTRVFEGRVEVGHPKTGELVALVGGQFNTSTAGKLEPPVAAVGGLIWPAVLGPAGRGNDWKRLSPSQDAYIGRAFIGDTEVHRSDTLLLVKNGSVNRKAYLEFDLQQAAGHQIVDAELMLEFAATGWGFASLVPDANFNVYGLLQSDCEWDEDSLSEWAAPANDRMGPGLEPSAVVKLGSFMIPQGVQRGQFGIHGPALAQFLNERAGTRTTLIVIRETRELAKDSLVHGFASRRHPSLPSPTLAIRLALPQPDLPSLDVTASRERISDGVSQGRAQDAMRKEVHGAVDHREAPGGRD